MFKNPNSYYLQPNMVNNPARKQEKTLKEIYTLLERGIQGCDNLCLEKSPSSEILLSYYNNNGHQGYEGLTINPMTPDRIQISYVGLVELADKTFKAGENGNPDTPFSQMKEQLYSQARNNSDWALLDVVANYSQARTFLRQFCGVMKAKEKKEQKKQ